MTISPCWCTVTPSFSPPLSPIVFFCLASQVFFMSIDSSVSILVQNNLPLRPTCLLPHLSALIWRPVTHTSEPVCSGQETWKEHCCGLHLHRSTHCFPSALPQWWRRLNKLGMCYRKAWSKGTFELTCKSYFIWVLLKKIKNKKKSHNRRQTKTIHNIGHHCQAISLDKPVV